MDETENSSGTVVREKPQNQQNKVVSFVKHFMQKRSPQGPDGPLEGGASAKPLPQTEPVNLDSYREQRGNPQPQSPLQKKAA